MILHIHSDASYLSVSRSGSRLGGIFYCGDKSPQEDRINSYIINVAAVIKNLVAAAAESEVGACFQKSQCGAPLRVTFMGLGHKQPATPLRTYTSTVFDILNKVIKNKRSKAMEMRYHCLTDRVRQNLYHIYSHPGIYNLVYYHSKQPSAQHHIGMLRLVPHQDNSLNVLQGFVKLPHPHLHTRTYAYT